MAADPSKIYFIDGKLLNDLQRGLKWQRNFRVAGASFVNTPDGAALTIPSRDTPQTRQSDPHFWAKVTSSAAVSGGGTGGYKYAWTEQQPTELGFTDGGYNRTGTTTERFALSLAEINATSNGPLKNGTFVYIRASMDTDGVWRYRIIDTAQRLVLCYVTIDSAGGSEGSPTTNCTLTYTAKDAPSGNVLGGDLTPAAPARYDDCEYRQVAADSPAIGYTKTDGTFGLLFVPGEIPVGDVVTVVTDYRIDTATQKFQKKTRDLLVLEMTDETDWTDVHTGDLCE